MIPGPYHYGRRSRDRLATVVPPLVRVFERAILHMDIAIVCGVRTAEEQQAALDATPPTTTLAWPDSNHNVAPPRKLSRAVDAGPWDSELWNIAWQDIAAFERMADLVFACAAAEGVRLRWGGDWDMGGDRNPAGSLEDLPHFEVLE